MGKALTDKAYRDAFMTRVYSAREHAGLTQEQMAHILQTNQVAYSKYETRSLLPHRHMWTFCLTCQIGADWLISGSGKGVPIRERPVPERRRGRRARRIAA
jgi:DNA-binding XRE family transcriptional regulator